MAQYSFAEAIDSLAARGELTPATKPNTDNSTYSFAEAIASLGRRGELEPSRETQFKQQQASSLSWNLSKTPEPNQAALDQKLTKELGLAHDTLATANPQYALALRTLRDTPERFVEKYPQLSSVLSKPEILAIAKDDLQSLQKVEDVLKNIKEEEEVLDWDVEQDESVGFSNIRLREKAKGTATAIYSALPGIAEGFDGLSLAVFDVITGGLNINHPSVKAFRNRINTNRLSNQAYKNYLTSEAQEAFDSELAKLAVSGVASGGQNLSALGTAALLGIAGAPVTVGTMALGMMGLTAMGSAYGEGQDEGLNTGLALLHGAITGGLEVATEKLGLASLIKMGKATGLRNLLNHGKNYLLGEHAGEQINTLLGDFESWALIDKNKGKTFGDYLAERGQKAFETAVITTVGGGVQMGGVISAGATSKAVDALRVSMEQAKVLRQNEAKGIRSRELFDMVTELSTTSKIAMRAPEAMPEIVAGLVGDKVPYAYIPADILNQEGVGDLLLQSAPELAEAVEASKASGVDIKVPMESMVRLVQNPSVNEAIHQDVKFSPEELTPKEAQTRLETLGQEVEERFQQEMEAANLNRQDELKQVEGNISSQLIEAGMLPEQAKANGKLHAAFFNSLAVMYGNNTSPLELSQRYPLRIVRSNHQNGNATSLQQMSPQEKLDLLNESRKTDEAIKDFLSKPSKRRSNRLIFGKPRWVMKIFGVPDTPISVSRKVLEKVFEGKHANEITTENVKGLWTAIQNPLAVFASETDPNAKVFITELNVDGQPVVVPLSVVPIEGQTHIKSIYPKNSVKKWLRDGKLLGYEKEKGTSYLNDMGSSEGLLPIHYLSRKSESSLEGVPKSKPIVYQNDTSVADLYQSESSNLTAEQKLQKEREAWEKQVDDLEAKPRQPLVMLSQTPLAMHMVGADFLTLKAHPHLFDGVFPGNKSNPGHHEHRLVDKNVLKQIPKALTDPVAIVEDERNRSFVFFLDVRDKGGESVVVPIAFNAKENRSGEINLAKTAFGRNRAWLELQVLNNALRYINTKKIKSLNDKPGANSLRWFKDLQAPENEFSNADGYSVLTEKDLVKLQQQYKSYYQSQAEPFGSYSRTQGLVTPLKKVESCRDVLENCVNGSSVMNLDGTEFMSSERSIQDTVAEFFEQNYGGVVENLTLGTVKLNKRSVKDSVSHGIGRNKSMAFAAVPEVIRQGKVFDFQPNWKGRNYDTYVIAAPIAIKDEKYVCEVVVLDSGTSKRFYLHEVNPLKDIVAATQQDPYREGQQPQPARPVRSILVQRYLESNKEGEDLHQSPNGRLGSYSRTHGLVTLFQQSNASTFVHESGHFFLDVMTDLANQMDAPQRLKNDMEILMKWFGVENLEKWNAMSFEEKRQYHEKFARGFERYMREGKAPSIKLMRVFHSFMNWLKSVYSSVRQLNVKLTPEVRQVMDRMLATDKEIRDAKAVLRLANTGITREMFPGTDQEWYEWEEKIKDEDDFARARLATQLIGERAFLDKRTREYIEKYSEEDEAWKEAYKEHYHEACEKLKEEKVYKAKQALEAKDKDGKVPYPISRLDLEGLPSEHIEALDRLGLLADDGYPIDAIAHQFGYATGQELASDLAFYENLPLDLAAKDLAEANVKKEFGHRMTAQKVKELAQKAALNDLTLERLGDEVALLKSGKRDPFVLQAAKVWAQQQVSGTSIKDLNANTYRQAMEKYGRAYERALVHRDTKAAFEAKRNQLFNAAAMKEILQAQEDVERVLKNVKRMSIRYRKVLRKEQDAGYLDQILNLAGKYGIRPEHKPRESYTSFAESMEELGRPMGQINPEIFSDAAAKPYDQLTVDEFTELETAFSVLEFQGRRTRQAELARQKQKAKNTVEVILEEMVPGKKVNRNTGLEPPNAWLSAIDAAFMAHRKFSSLMREIGGLKDDTELMRIVAKLNQCGDKETLMLSKAGEKLVSLFDSIKGTKLASKTISIKGERHSRSWAISVALNYGNKMNKERLLNSLNEEEQKAVLSQLTKEELEFVQNTWDLLESYWPLMERLEKRTNGIAPRKVEAEPFTVRSVDGYRVAMKGGYYPIVYNPEQNVVSAEQQMKELGTEMVRGATQSSMTKQSHMKSRSQKVERALLLDLSVIGRHLQQVTHDICFREWVQETNRVFRNKDFKQAVAQNFGVNYYKALSDHLIAIASGGSAMTNPAIEGIFRKTGNFLKGNVTFNAMALSVTTAALQPLGITQSIQRIGSKWVMLGGMKFAANPLEAVRECHNKSIMMRERADVLNADIADFNALTHKGKVGKYSRLYEKLAFAPMQYMQMLVDIPTWHGAYQKALAEGHSESRSREIADQVVLDSQGGGHNKDRSIVHRNHPFLTMFYSYFSSMENLWAESASSQDYKSIKGQVGFLRDATLLLLIPSVGQAIIFSALRGDDWDDKDTKDWMLEMLGSIGGTALGMFIILRECAAVFSGFGYQGPPISRILSDVGKAATTLMSDRAEADDQVLAGLNIVADIFKVPYTQIRRTYKGWKAYIEGESEMPTSILFGAPRK